MKKENCFEYYDVDDKNITFYNINVKYGDYGYQKSHKVDLPIRVDFFKDMLWGDEEEYGDFYPNDKYIDFDHSLEYLDKLIDRVDEKLNKYIYEEAYEFLMNGGMNLEWWEV